MATFTVTQVYVVRAKTPEAALTTLASWRTSGLDYFDVQLEFQSVRLESTEGEPGRGENPWLGELKRQLLGHEVPGQQPASGKRQS